MGDTTGISYVDHTWNCWQGCHEVSAGCLHCFMYRDKIRYGQDPSVVVRSKPHTFNSPTRWKEPAVVFVCSWSDFFIEEADPWRDEAWDIIRRTPHLTYVIVTKRPERIVGHTPPGWPRDFGHVWVLATTENQEQADIRVPILLTTPCPHRGVSVEPMLGPVDLEGAFTRPGFDGIEQVVLGGESGSKARPYCCAWGRRLIEQCADAGVPVYHKQVGANFIDGCGARFVIKHRSGANPAEWPEYLRVQQLAWRK